MGEILLQIPAISIFSSCPSMLYWVAGYRSGGREGLGMREEGGVFVGRRKGEWVVGGEGGVLVGGGKAGYGLKD